MTAEQEYRLNALRQLIAACGEQVVIDGEPVQAFVEEITYDEAALAGGLAEDGGYRVTVPAPDIDRPDKAAGITARGDALDILSVTDRNGVSYEITAGSLVRDA